VTWTRREIDALIGEFEADLIAYKEAFDVLQRRSIEVENSTHAEFFSRSSGCLASIHVLIMNISSTEGIIEDLRKNRDEMPVDRPPLTLVKEV
jgi:hypothetical protein